MNTLLNILHGLEKKKFVLKRWAPNQEFAKALKSELRDEFVERVTGPALTKWRQYVYAYVVPFINDAVAFYDRKRLATGSMTFQDLLLRAKDLLRDHPQVRRYFQSRYQSLFVDEFQDTDPVQAELLLYRSNLLGSDKRITNYGGGNTSAKITQPDPLTGEASPVLWVKGSGGDLGSMALDGFATLYLDKLRQLKKLYRGLEHEDEMVGYLPHCTFDLNPRAASIDTPLHAYIPHAHVDHMHPDAVIAIASTVSS